MSAKSVLLTGDIAIFEIAQGAVLLAPAQIPIRGSSEAQLVGRIVCVEGDEESAVFPSCPYTAPGFPIPGVVSCHIKKLSTSHISTKMSLNGKKALYIGSSKFDAEYRVLIPASQPPPLAGSSASDPTKKYSGKGSFTAPADYDTKELESNATTSEIEIHEISLAKEINEGIEQGLNQEKAPIEIPPLSVEIPSISPMPPTPEFPLIPSSPPFSGVQHSPPRSACYDICAPLVSLQTLGNDIPDRELEEINKVVMKKYAKREEGLPPSEFKGPYSIFAFPEDFPKDQIHKPITPPLKSENSFRLMRDEVSPPLNQKDQLKSVFVDMKSIHTPPSIPQKTFQLPIDSQKHSLNSANLESILKQQITEHTHSTKTQLLNEKKEREKKEQIHEDKTPQSQSISQKDSKEHTVRKTEVLKKVNFDGVKKLFKSHLANFEGLQESPKLAATPPFPGIQSESSSSFVSMPEIPSIPSLPSLAALPSLNASSSAVNVPNIPAFPEFPELSALPGLPATPEVPPLEIPVSEIYSPSNPGEGFFSSVVFPFSVEELFSLLDLPKTAPTKNSNDMLVIQGMPALAATPEVPALPASSELSSLEEISGKTIPGIHEINSMLDSPNNGGASESTLTSVISVWGQIQARSSIVTRYFLCLSVMATSRSIVMMSIANCMSAAKRKNVSLTHFLKLKQVESLERSVTFENKPELLTPLNSEEDIKEEEKKVRAPNKSSFSEVSTAQFFSKLDQKYFNEGKVGLVVSSSQYPFSSYFNKHIENVVCQASDSGHKVTILTNSDFQSSELNSTPDSNTEVYKNLNEKTEGSTFVIFSEIGNLSDTSASTFLSTFESISPKIPVLVTITDSTRIASSPVLNQKLYCALKEKSEHSLNYERVCQKDLNYSPEVAKEKDPLSFAKSNPWGELFKVTAESS